MIKTTTSRLAASRTQIRSKDNADLQDTKTATSTTNDDRHKYLQRRQRQINVACCWSLFVMMTLTNSGLQSSSQLCVHALLPTKDHRRLTTRITRSPFTTSTSRWGSTQSKEDSDWDQFSSSSSASILPDLPDTVRRRQPMNTSKRQRQSQQQQQQQQQQHQKQFFPNATTTVTSATAAMEWRQDLPREIPRLSDLLKEKKTTKYTTSTATTPPVKKSKAQPKNKRSSKAPTTVTAKRKSYASSLKKHHKRSASGNSNAPRPKRPQQQRQQEQQQDLSSQSSPSPKYASSSSPSTSSTSARPWKASFQASIRTQGRIKKAFYEGPSLLSPTQKAIYILEELWRTPSQFCNEANLIASLTFSAKALGKKAPPRHDDDSKKSKTQRRRGASKLAPPSNSKDNSDSTNPDQEELRRLLWDTIDVLMELVKVDQALSTRQLANAVWAIAKHADRDPKLLLPPTEYTTLSSERAIGQAERWYLGPSTSSTRTGPPRSSTTKSSHDRPKQQRVEEFIDEVARQFTGILRSQLQPSEMAESDFDESAATKNQKQPSQQPPAKIGEICMVSWAYGKLRPRSTPPGWQDPPQLGKVSGNAMKGANSSQRAKQDPNLITFETWGEDASSFGGKTDTETNSGNDDSQIASLSTSNIAEENVTDELFKAIGAALCQEVTPNDSRPSQGSRAKGRREEVDGTASSPSRRRLALRDCSWSELANVGWSFASHGFCKSREAETLMVELAREARCRLDSTGPHAKRLLVRDLAQIVWALGTLQADNFRLADDLVDLVESLSNYLQLGETTQRRRTTFGKGRPLQRWSCADLVQVALSLAHARIDELPLLRAIFEESNYRLLEGLYDDGLSSASIGRSAIHHRPLIGGINSEFEERKSFRAWEVSILLWAQARLHLLEEQGLEFEEFASDAPKFYLKAIAKAPYQSLMEHGVGPQEQANLVWALTVLEKHQSRDAVDLIRKIFDEAATTCQTEKTIQLEHAHQLWQAYFLLEEESPEAVADIPEWLVDYLKDKWNLEKARDKLSSARHRAISQTLQLMGVDHYNEHDEDIDVAIVLKGGAAWTHETEAAEEAEEGTWMASRPAYERNGKVSVAVEFDGPNHFTRGNEFSEQPRALGHTVLKYRLLRKQGWSVVRVPFFEFDKIPFWASMERQRYLQRKLKTHANITFSEVDVSEYSAINPNRKSRFD